MRTWIKLMTRERSSHRSRRGESKYALGRRRAAFECLEDRRVMAVDFASAIAVGGAASESVWDLTLDSAGNTFVVGRFSGTVDFDPSVGAYELTSAPSGTGNTFAAKYDLAGNILWAQQFGGNLNNFGPEIAAGSDGSVYVVGSFTGSAQFGDTTLTSLGNNDAYVVKLDANGGVAWALQFGAANEDYGNSVAVDGVGNVYMMGETRTSANLSPDAFIAKMDANGIVQWTQAIGASSSTTTKGRNTTISGWARGFKLTVDPAGDIYATGRMGGTVDFDAGSGTTALAGAGFVTKLSTGGNLIWARTFTGTIVEPHDIVVDDSGNVYSTGIYTAGSVDFDPGTAKSQKFILTTAYFGSYVSALDSNGNFRWAKSTSSIDSNNFGWADALAVDGHGDVYAAGYFVGTVDFDPGAGTSSLASAGELDAFVWKLNASGNFAWAGRMGGAGVDRAQGVGLDASGSIYVAGSFTGTADFDPGIAAHNLISAGGNDFFVAKFVQPVALAALVSQSQSNSLLLATTPTRRLSSKAADSAFAGLGDDDAAGWNDSLDDVLLLILASS